MVVSIDDSYRLLGMTTADTVVTLGSGVNGSVRRMGYTFNTQGLPELSTSYSDTSGTTVVNQVKRIYNGLGQLTTEYQDHDGGAGPGSPFVGYTYSEMASSANHFRLTSMTYPDGHVLSYNYATGLDDSISRLSSLSDTSGTLESYTYLGLSVLVARTRPTANQELSYISATTTGDAGDQYVGLSRFGQIVDQNWSTLDSTPVTLDRFVYGYDRDGNPLYKQNMVGSADSELYTYDSLNRLATFARGTLEDSNSDGIPDAIDGTPSAQQTFTMDALGNMASDTSRP